MQKNTGQMIAHNIEFPESITGKKAGLFNPMSTGAYHIKDDASGDADPLFQFLYAATRPTRVSEYAAIQENKKVAKLQKLISAAETADIDEE